MEELEKLYHLARNHAPEVGLGFFLRGVLKEGSVEGAKFLLRRMWETQASPLVPTKPHSDCPAPDCDGGKGDK